MSLLYQKAFKTFLEAISSCRRGSYYSGGRTIRGGRSNPGSTVYQLEYYISVHDCPGLIECSGNGECDQTNGSCKCYDGFSGFDCSGNLKKICFNLLLI